MMDAIKSAWSAYKPDYVIMPQKDFMSERVARRWRRRHLKTLARKQHARK